MVYSYPAAIPETSRLAVTNPSSIQPASPQSGFLLTIPCFARTRQYNLQHYLVRNVLITTSLDANADHNTIRMLNLQCRRGLLLRRRNSPPIRPASCQEITEQTDQNSRGPPDRLQDWILELVGGQIAEIVKGKVGVTGAVPAMDWYGSRGKGLKPSGLRSRCRRGERKTMRAAASPILIAPAWSSPTTVRTERREGDGGD